MIFSSYIGRGQHVIAPVVAGDSSDGGRDGEICPNDY